MIKLLNLICFILVWYKQLFEIHLFYIETYIEACNISTRIGTFVF